MAFDVETAIPVVDREDGLTQKVGSFDVSTAVPAPETEIHAAKPGEIPYSPALRPEQKAQAVVERTFREKGEEVPIGLKADWAITSPTAKMTTANIVGGLATGGAIPALNALRGIASARQQNSSIGRMIFENAYQGLAESETNPNLGESAVKAYPGMNWLEAGAMGAMAEMIMLAPGIFKAGGELAGKGVQAIDDSMSMKLLNDYRASPQYGDIVTAMAEKKGMTINEVDDLLYKKIWSQRNDVGFLSKFNHFLGEAGEVRIPKIGESVSFEGADKQVMQGTIKEISGERVIIDMNGKQIVATLSQLSSLAQPQQPSIPVAGAVTHEVPETMKKWMEKGVTITERQAPIRITDPEAKIKDVSGNVVDLPKGHEMTPYKLSNGKIWLHDGKNVIVDSGQLQNLANKNLVLGKNAAPREEGIEEVVKGSEGKTKAMQRIEKEFKDTGLVIEKDFEGETHVYKGDTELNPDDVYEQYPQLSESANQYSALARGGEGSNISDVPNFDRYQLPGGENYKEVLFKAPEEKPIVGDMVFKSNIGKWVVEDTQKNILYEAKNKADAEDKYIELRKDKQGFKSSHWDEPNVISHARINDRTTPDGKKILFIEEIQSDWAREGREKGFQVARKEIPLHRTAPKDDGFTIVDTHGNDLTPNSKFRTPQEAEREFDRFINPSFKGAVPFHPLLKSWQEFTLKRILEKAVKEGYDGIAWTTGEQQANRYDLSKQVDRITYDPNGDIIAYQGRKSVLKKHVGFDIEKARIESEKYIGKEPARKLFEKKDSNGFREIGGEELIVGGEWAKNLYDKQIPNILKDLTKGEVVNVPVLKLPGLKEHNPGAAYMQQPALMFTPDVRAKLIGQPMAGGLPIERKQEMMQTKLQRRADREMKELTKQEQELVERVGNAFYTAGKKVGEEAKKVRYFGEGITPLERRDLYVVALNKGLIYVDYTGKEHDKLRRLLRYYRGASFDQLKNYISALSGDKEHPSLLFKLYGDIDKDSEALKVINKVKDGWRDINKLEIYTLDPVRIVEKVSLQNVWDENVLADNTFNILSAADEALFDRKVKELTELDKNREGIMARSKDSAEIMRKFEAKETLAPKEQRVVDFLRSKYDVFIKEANEMRKLLGRKPIPYRQDYMTHIIEQNLLHDFFRGNEGGMKSVSADQIEAIRKGDYTKGNMPFNRFAQKRKGTQTELDAIGNFIKYMDVILKEIYYTPSITHVRKFIEYALDKTPNAYKAIDRMLSDIKGKTSIVDQNLIETIAGSQPVKWIRSHIARNALVGNINFWVMNLSNFSVAYDELGNYLNIGMAKFLGNKEIRQFAFENSVMLKGRQVDPDFMDQPIHTKLEELVGGVTNLIEYNNVGSTWVGAYTKAIDRLNYPKEQAIQYADAIARRTQVGYKKYELNAWMRSNSGMLMSQFQTWTFNAMNHILYDLGTANIPKDIASMFGKEKTNRTRWGAFITLVVTSMMVNSIYQWMQLRGPYSPDAAMPSVAGMNPGRYSDIGPIRIGKDVVTAVTSKKAETRRRATIRAVTSLIPGGTQISRFLSGNVFPQRRANKKSQPRAN
jgi:hypothetical protein